MIRQDTIYRCCMISFGEVIATYKQRFLGGNNVPLFCGITRVLKNYYRMAISHKLLNHNPITTFYDSLNTVRKYQQDHASNKILNIK